MASVTYEQSLVNSVKRLRLSSSRAIVARSSRPFSQKSTKLNAEPLELTPATASGDPGDIRLPLAVQATYLNPLRRTPVSKIVTCELQLRSYSVRNVEIFTDFALRAAYYLNLAAKGPKPLPRITERWTVPRANFVHKKSQENFERITLRRSIQILGGHPRVVAVWLAYLQEHRYYGIGLKANVWEYGGLDTAKELSDAAEKLPKSIREELRKLGGPAPLTAQKDDAVMDLIHRQPLKAAWGASAPMGGAESTPTIAKQQKLVTVLQSEQEVGKRFQSKPRSQAGGKAKEKPADEAKTPTE